MTISGSDGSVPLAAREVFGGPPPEQRHHLLSRAIDLDVIETDEGLLGWAGPLLLTRIEQG